MSRRHIVFLFILLLVVCNVYGKRRKLQDTIVIQWSKVDSLIGFASGFVGTPYKSRKYSERAFDCSGFTRFVFGNFGYKLGASSAEQIFDGAKVERNELSRGDLVFFKGRDASSNRIGHVGIVVEVDSVSKEFKFIHSSTRQGVIVDNFPMAYYSNRYIGACRVIGLDALPKKDSLAPIQYKEEMVEVNCESDSVTKAQKDSESHIVHVVRKGDTLYAISKKYSITIDKLMTINNLKSTNLQIGKQLKIK